MEVVIKRHHWGNGYEIVLLDWKLPDMDGIATVRPFREKFGNHVPILLIFAFDWAKNGEICVEKFQRSPAGFYDAILMDIRMPVIRGYEATQAIRTLERQEQDLPIIAMTADVFAEDVCRSLECSMNAHVARPIDVQEVMCLLNQFIKQLVQPPHGQ